MSLTRILAFDMGAAAVDPLAGEVDATVEPGFDVLFRDLRRAGCTPVIMSDEQGFGLRSVLRKLKVKDDERFLAQRGYHGEHLKRMQDDGTEVVAYVGDDRHDVRSPLKAGFEVSSSTATQRSQLKRSVTIG